MRISDWSSDVFSSVRGHHRHLVGDARIGVRHHRAGVLRPVADLPYPVVRRRKEQRRRNGLAEKHFHAMSLERRGKDKGAVDVALVGRTDRTRVVAGKSVAVRLTLAARSATKKK